MSDSKLPDTLDELNIKYLKLMNGDTILSYIHDHVADHMIGLEEPMSVTIDENQSYILTPYLPFATKSVHLLDSYQVVIESDVQPYMKAQYMKLVLDEIKPLDADIDTDTVLH